MTDDFEITVKVRNNLLLTKMRETGIENMSELAERMGCSAGMIHNIVNMKLPARRRNTEWRTAVVKVAEFLGCTPEEIIPESVQDNILAKNTSSFTANLPDIDALIGNLRTMALPASARLDGEERQRGVHEILRELTPKEERVLRLRFGIGCEPKTHEEIGQEFGVTRERIRQIELRALRRLRRPHRATRLIQLLPDENSQ